MEKKQFAEAFPDFGEVCAENYEEKRKILQDANANLLGVVLSENEQALDVYLKKCLEEYRESCGGTIPYDVPVLADENIRKSRLYDFCSRMPKGAELHVHDMTLLPVGELAELLCECPEFYVQPGSCVLACCGTDGAPDASFVSFAQAIARGLVTKADLLREWTVLGAADGENIWDYFEGLFAKHGALSAQTSFVYKYYVRALRYYCERKAVHLEIHLMMDMEREKCTRYVEAIRSAYYAVKEDYPYLTVRIIGAGVKADSENLECSRLCFENTVYTAAHITDCSEGRERPFVIGFDLVNEEDSAFPLKTFAPMLLRAGKMYPDLHLYIHGGESLDAGNDNLIDAFLLGASRVGHGLNLYRYPDLHRRYAEAEICLEVCPVSNQALGYTRDIRNHPVVEYLKTGVPVAICSDDPLYMEHETLTDDYFAAAVGWGLGVAELKQLCINSILYSGLDQEDRIASMRAFGILWNEFVNYFVKNI